MNRSMFKVSLGYHWHENICLDGVESGLLCVQHPTASPSSHPPQHLPETQPQPCSLCAHCSSLCFNMIVSNTFLKCSSHCIIGTPPFESLQPVALIQRKCFSVIKVHRLFIVGLLTIISNLALYLWSMCLGRYCALRLLRTFVPGRCR